MTEVGIATRARIISVYATKWRYTGEAGDTLARLIDLGELAETYEPMQEQLPRPLVRREPDTIAFGDGTAGAAVAWAGAWLFALPSDQTVTAFWFDLDIAGRMAATVDALLDSRMRADVRIDGEELSDYVQRLAEADGATPHRRV